LLEVSSPGLERELYSQDDFKKFAGNLAKVKTSQTIDGQKNFRGRIVAVEGEEIVFDDKTKGLVRFGSTLCQKPIWRLILKKNLSEVKSGKRKRKWKMENKRFFI
jgi:ribosome maturation factor RimP